MELLRDLMSIVLTNHAYSTQMRSYGKDSCEVALHLTRFGGHVIFFHFRRHHDVGWIDITKERNRHRGAHTRIWEYIKNIANTKIMEQNQNVIASFPKNLPDDMGTLILSYV